MESTDTIINKKNNAILNGMEWAKYLALLKLISKWFYILQVRYILLNIQER